MLGDSSIGGVRNPSSSAFKWFLTGKLSAKLGNGLCGSVQPNAKSVPLFVQKSDPRLFRINDSIARAKLGLH